MARQPSRVGSAAGRFEPDDDVVADQIQAPAVGDDRRVAGLLQLEGLLVGEGVEADRAVGLEAGGVDGVADHGGGAGDRAADVVVPARLAGGGVERVEAAVFGADVDGGRGAGNFGQGGGAVDGATGVEGPLDLAGPFVEGEDGAVVASGVDAAEADRGGGEEAALAVRRHLAGVGAPERLSRGRGGGGHRALGGGGGEAGRAGGR